VTEGRLRVAIAALALAGIGVASYLTYSRYSGTPLFCSTGGCDTVQHSRYALIAGVPVAVLGLIAYGCILGTASVRGAAAAATGFGLAVAGLLFGAYLLYAQLALIHAVCQWCLASDVVVSLLAVTTWARVLVAGHSGGLAV
jgi:uncharacterized membrane protein